MTVVGNSYGVRLQSERANQGGTITSTWKNQAGLGFVYSGAPQANIALNMTSQLLQGKVRQVLGISVTHAAFTKDQALSAAIAYRTAGRSTLNDAIRVGVSPVLAKARFGAGSAQLPSTVTVSMASSSGTIYDSWCVNAISSNSHAQGCVTRYLLHTNGGDWYLSDDMEALGSGSPLLILQISMTYSVNNQVVHWIPTGSESTGCSGSVTVSATWFGVGFSSNNQLCNGTMTPFVNTSTSNGSMGAQWLGFTSQSIGIEPIDLFHDPPNATPLSTLHIAVG